jgi:polyisoprenoid-binding protein YceI
VSTTTSTGQATTYDIDASHTTVEFVVRHLMISKVRGRFTGVKGTIVVPAGAKFPSAAEIDIDPATIDTREEQRDGHLKSPDFLDVAQFPSLTFKSTSCEGDGDDFKLLGDLTIHGTTKPVELDCTHEGTTVDPWGNARIGFSAHAKISRKEFGLGWNQALEAGGVVISDDVRIEINLEVLAQN